MTTLQRFFQALKIQHPLEVGIKFVASSPLSVFHTQDVTHKLCETLSMVANIGISQPDYVLVKMASNPPPGQEEDGDGSAREDSGSATEGSASEGPVHPPESAVEGGTAAAAAGVVKSREATTGHVRNGEVGRIRGKMEGKSASEELLQPTLQALAVLSNVSGLNYASSLSKLLFSFLASSLLCLPPSQLRFWRTSSTVFLVVQRKTRSPHYSRQYCSMYGRTFTITGKVRGKGRGVLVDLW